MMRYGRALLAGMMLAGCAALPDAGQPVPPAGTPVIEIAQGTAFSVISVTRIYATDVATVRRWGGALDDPPPDQSHDLLPGTYARLSAIVAAEGPRVAALLPAEEDFCMDYGTDAITAVAADGESSEIMGVCPHEPLLALIDRLLAETTDAFVPR